MARRITLEQRARLLKAVKLGHDLEAAAAQVEVPLAIVSGDVRLMAEVAEAYRGATAKLRAKLLEKALAANDPRTLADLLEEREQVQREMAASTPGKLDFSKFSHAQLQTFERLMEAALAGTSPTEDADLEGMRARLEAEVARHAEAHHRQLRAEIRAEVLQEIGIPPAPRPEPLEATLGREPLDTMVPLEGSRAPGRAAPQPPAAPPPQPRYAILPTPLPRSLRGSPWDRGDGLDWSR